MHEGEYEGEHEGEAAIRELTERWNAADMDGVVALLDDGVEIDAARRVLNGLPVAAKG